MRLRLPVLSALFVSVLLSACSVLPERGEPALPIPEVPYQEFTLDNGLTLIVHEDRSAPLVAVNIWYHVGSKNEPAGRTGFAHLFEHLMFNGSENYNDEFFRPLENAGATGMNGTTNADRTNYFATVPTPALDTLLWLESDRMGHLLGAIDQAKLDEQRGVVQNERRQRDNQPYGKIWNLIPGYTYPPEHPYSWPTIGSMADLEAASLDDVKDWFRTWYGPSNAVVVIAGDISAAEARQKVEHFFGDIPPGPQLSRPRHWPAPMTSSRDVQVEDQVPQARTYFVWNVAPNYSADLIELQLAADALANGKNSRLYQKLVHQDQTATDVGAFVLPREMGSQFMIWVTAKPDVAIENLETQVLDVVGNLIQAGPSEDEVARSRTGLYVGLIQGLQKLGGDSGRSGLLASAKVLTGEASTWKQELRWLESASRDSVRETLGRWLGHGHLKLRVVPAAKGKAAESGADRSKLPEAGVGKPLQLPELQRASLSNGLPVVLLERRGVPLVEMRLMANGGYSSDPKGKEGLANLAMSLLDEGAGELDSLQLAEALERIGASIGSGASLDRSVISLSAVSTLLEPALDLYAKVIREPSFPADELARLVPRVLAGIEQERANPVSVAMRALPPLLFGDTHPYGTPLTGSGRPESIASITRADIQRYHQSTINPANSQLLIVGDLSMERALPLLEARFGDWHSDATPKSILLPPVPQASKPRIFLLDRPGAPQTLLLAGGLAPSLKDPDDLAMKAADGVFGGQFTSRLNMNLREDKHWSYGASSFLIGTQAQRPFVVYSRVQADKTVESMREIRWEMERMLTKAPIRPEELDSVVRQKTLSLPGANETLGQIAGSVAHLLNNGLPDDYYSQLVTQLNAMTPEQAQTGAEKLLHPDAMTWIVIGDLAAHRESIKALKWGEVRELDAGAL